MATVNGEPISLDALVAELGPSVDRDRLRQGYATVDELQLLDRLINVRLVAGEAAVMGLDEAPEVQKQAEVMSRAILRDLLLERIVKDARPDPAAVEKIYRQFVEEWKTAGLLFQDEAQANRARAEIDAGATFADVAEKAVAAKTATSDNDSAYHTATDYLPPIAEAIKLLQPGQVSPVTRVPTGFVLVKVLDVRYPDNAEARAQAEETVLKQRQNELLHLHEEALRRESLVINQAVLDGIDYTAPEPGFDALLKDKRVVAEIKGAAPVTVGDLTDYLRMQLFHDSTREAERQKMNQQKREALEATVSRRLLNAEALSLGIDKTGEYLDRVAAYRDGLVFDSFVQKVILPDSKMREEEVKGYYDAHIKDYAYPEMVRVRSLAFTRRAPAESAMEKLQGGTDYSWLAANAEGQADGTTQGVVTFDGRPVTTDSMPEGMQRALAGAKVGDFRLYAAPGDLFYVIAVQDVVPATAKPYAEVREEIARKLFDEKLKKNLDDYLGKLRAGSEVEVYLKKAQ